MKKELLSLSMMALSMGILAGCEEPAESANQKQEAVVQEVEDESSSEQTTAEENESEANDSLSDESVAEETEELDEAEVVNETGTEGEKNNETVTENEKSNETVAEQSEEAVESEQEGPSKSTYLADLFALQSEVNAVEAIDSSTYALKKVEDDRLVAWDTQLNEIYGALESALPEEEMEALRTEQRAWIEQRDKTALEASLPYKGRTQEHLEYTTVMANVTEERCFELVEQYMK